MQRAYLVALAIAMLAAPALASSDKKCGAPKSGEVRIGMSRAAVLQTCWRGPAAPTRLESGGHVYERYLFNAGFDAVYLVDGVVYAVQSGP